MTYGRVDGRRRRDSGFGFHFPRFQRQFLSNQNTGPLHLPPSPCLIPLIPTPAAGVSLHRGVGCHRQCQRYAARRLIQDDLKRINGAERTPERIQRARIPPVGGKSCREYEITRDVVYHYFYRNATSIYVSRAKIRCTESPFSPPRNLR